MNIKKNTVKKIFCVTALALLLVCIPILNAEARDISPAIDILRSKTTFSKCALCGTDASFTKEDFNKVVGCDFEYITITKIPNKELGTLKISGVDIIEGQSIVADNLDLLKFIPVSKELKEIPSFTFSVSDDKWKNTDIECSINYLSSVNYSPIAQSFKINTYKNISVYSELNVYDPDDDEIKIKIETYPTFGNVELNDGLNRITYTPEKNFTGNDVFTIYAEDIYGNKSNSANVYVTVNSDSGNVIFGDMADNKLHFAAIALSQNNIMTYSQKGGEYYFSPNEEVNKIDFTVMLLCAAELNSGIMPVKDTEFIDDKKLSIGKKSYLKRALETEVIDINDGFFKPDNTITSKEAKIMVARSLGLDPDSKKVSTIMGNSVLSETLTKEDVAEILYNVCLYLN